MVVAAPTSCESGVSGVGRLEALVDRVDVLLDEIAELAWSTVETADLAAVVVRLPELAARVDAIAGRVCVEAHYRCVPQADGHRTVDQHILASSNADGAEVRALVRRGRWLEDFPRFADAATVGVLTPAHVDLIRRKLDRPKFREPLLRDQHVLIDAARDCDYRGFETVVGYWANAADPDGDEPKDQIAKSRCSISRRGDGMVTGSFLLDPLTGATVLDAFNRESQRLAVTDDNDGAVRSQALRSVHALANLITRGTAAAGGAFPEPLINVVMSLNVAEAAIDRYINGQPIDIELGPNDVDRRCELIDGTPIHPWFVLHVLGVAALRRVVLTAKSKALDASVLSRTFPKYMRDLTRIRTRGRCEEPGCDAPFHWLQTDHRRPHSKAGATTLANAQTLCRPHNLAKSDRW